MLQTIQVSDKYFVANKQYEYSDTTYAFVTAFGVDKKDIGRHCIHYLVTIGLIAYWIPSCSCVEYDKVIPENEQNKQQYYFDSITDQTKDVIAQVKQAFGIQINNNAGADIDLRAYNELIAENPTILSNHEGVLPQE